ncbi:hypothetical protein [Motiliproteus sp. SC1-56]|uniref:hypothetical protein n=1 Tax=Motiliproteus sp. SC1-56 TaxID=2799565 RepID=UPI001A8F111E|nr:hypothetical protein [Motiliproteus sp. SC1-56]
MRLSRLSAENAATQALLNKNEIIDHLKQHIALANQVQAQVSAVAQLVSKQVLSTTSVLWEPLAPPDTATLNSPAVKRIALQLIAALVLGALIGLLLALLIPRRQHAASPMAEAGRPQ